MMPADRYAPAQVVCYNTVPGVCVIPHVQSASSNHRSSGGIEMPPRGGFILPENLVLAGPRFRRRCHYRGRCPSVLGVSAEIKPSLGPLPRDSSVNMRALSQGRSLHVHRGEYNTPPRAACVPPALLIPAPFESWLADTCVAYAQSAGAGVGPPPLTAFLTFISHRR